MVLAAYEAKTPKINANKEKNGAVALKAQLKTSNEERDKFMRLFQNAETKEEGEDEVAEEELIKAHERFGDLIKKKFNDKREKNE